MGRIAPPSRPGAWRVHEPLSSIQNMGQLLLLLVKKVASQNVRCFAICSILIVVILALTELENRNGKRYSSEKQMY